MTLRYGLFGTGYWARQVHAPGIVAAPGTVLVGVWGRTLERAEDVAGAFGTRAYADADALIEAVDAVAVALPPQVQAPIALKAAQAGRHLLLDKPLALDPRVADDIARAAEERQVASLVFFTNRFLPEPAAWVTEQRARHQEQPWTSGHAEMLGSTFHEGSPYAGSLWRGKHGGLWDLGPHALSLLLPVLGPVVHVAGAQRDPDGSVHALLRHDGGAVSTMSVGIDVARSAATSSVTVSGPAGRSTVPSTDWDAQRAFANAVDDLGRLAAADPRARQHPCDVRLGAAVVGVLHDVQRALGAVAEHGADRA